jgi:hypothetical protein
MEFGIMGVLMQEKNMRQTMGGIPIANPKIDPLLFGVANSNEILDPLLSKKSFLSNKETWFLP